jgi:hypothetical protein
MRPFWLPEAAASTPKASRATSLRRRLVTMSAPTRPSGFSALKARARAGRSARAPVEVSEWTRRRPR